MKIQKVQDILQAELLCGVDLLETEVHSACGSDMMSDVLAFVKDQALLLTGLMNPQVVRTAEMMDIVCVIMVRDKQPDDAMIQMAAERNICLLATSLPMFSTCGLLYEAGLRGGASHGK